jgi:hypothetical protein
MVRSAGGWGCDMGSSVSWRLAWLLVVLRIERARATRLQLIQNYECRCAAHAKTMETSHGVPRRYFDKPERTPALRPSNVPCCAANR